MEIESVQLEMRMGKTVETVGRLRVAAVTQLKLGVNEIVSESTYAKNGTRRKIVLVVCLAVGLALVSALFYFSGARNPRLAVTYLSRTNDSGRWIAQFAVTNVGDAAAISYPDGDVQAFGQVGEVLVACKHKV